MDDKRPARERAESILRQAGLPPEAPPKLTRLVEELYVHQEELRLQNETLVEARNSLKFAEARFRDLFENAPIGYVLCDAEGIIRDANRRAISLLSKDLEKVRDVPFARFTTKESADDFYQHCQNTLRSGKLESCELRLEPAAGPASVVELHSITTDAEEGLLRIALIDITQRYELQASLAQSDRLARMGQLAAGVGHEINNPLAYVLHNLALLEMALSQKAQEESGVMRDYLEMAREALEGATRIQSITRMLASFTRAGSDERSPLDLHRAIHNAAKMIHNEIRFRAHLELDLQATAPILGSEGKLSQVFLNLLVNAMHALKEGHLDKNLIRVSTWSTDTTVFAEVTDSGVGITPEHIDRLFEPFFTTKPVGQGSGLGLSISKNLITEAGGTITCRSTPGEGTTFQLTFPTATDAASKEQQPTSLPQSDLSRRRILIVDDEPGILRVLRRRLARTHDVVCVSTGEDAQRQVSTDPSIDMIILDVMMPGMTGVDLHRWLTRTHPDLAKRVLFMTGGLFVPRINAYLANQKATLIDKPIDLRILLKLVNHIAGATQDES